jgi:hypothetical protein
MPSDEWIKTLADGSRVTFTNQEPDENAFITAQVDSISCDQSAVVTRNVFTPNDAGRPQTQDSPILGLGLNSSFGSRFARSFLLGRFVGPTL